jgi:ribosomal protein S18 acetylase RimI-like enzyme
VSTSIDVAELDASAARAAIDELADVLVDCVEGGASVSFMAPYTHAQAVGFFIRGIAAAIERSEIVLLAGRRNGRIVGTVQLGIRTPPNQPHRADVMKLLVRRDAREQGVGAALMRRLEAAARERGRTLLVLDTASDAAERLYERMGWTRVGVIPDYALLPHGGFCDTTLFWKRV